jgi:outer membrane lipoprotein-sorting protein
MRKPLSVVFFALIAALAGRSSADEVDEILEKVDANLTKVEDQTYTAELEVVRDGETIKTIEFVAKLKGLNKRVVEFTAPGDVRGMSILTTEDGLMYVYMPAYKRVRRVASHVRNQGFMGTDISPEEMSGAAFSVGWEAEMVSEDDESWVLKLEPKEGNESSYSKQLITVSKEHEGVTKVESFNESGKLVKSQLRTEWKDLGPIHLPTKFVVEDHNTGSKTIMRFNDCEVNKGIPDSSFTKRALMRGG